MAKYCERCMTIVPQGDRCPKCGNEELKPLKGFEIKEEKAPKKQTSLAEVKKAKKCHWMFACIGIAVLMIIVTVILVLMKGKEGETSVLPRNEEYKVEIASQSEREEENEIDIKELETVGYSEGLEFTLLWDNTYEVSGVTDDLLTKIEIPESYNGIAVTSIGWSAFNYCTNLTEIKIPDSVTNIASDAFRDCESLTELTIPKSVTSIGGYMFVGCKNLTNINVDKENKYYISEDGVFFTKDKTELILYPCKKMDSKYVIPNGVTRIQDCAFYACDGLTEITIPKSVTRIENWAIGSCSGLTKVMIPDSVTNIGDHAFYGCANLIEVTIPDSVTSIGTYVFDVCGSLTDIYYKGTEAEWNNIPKGENAIPGYVEIHFES